MGELGPGIGAGVAEPAIADGFARPLVDVQETVLPLTVDIHVKVDRTVAVFQLFGLILTGSFTRLISLLLIDVHCN